MTEKQYPIPNKLNLCIALVQLALLVAMFWTAAGVTTWIGLLGSAMAYGILMNSAYATIQKTPVMIPYQ